MYLQYFLSWIDKVFINTFIYAPLTLANASSLATPKSDTELGLQNFINSDDNSKILRDRFAVLSGISKAFLFAIKI